MRQRIQDAINETAKLLIKVEGRKTFDQYQEAEKQSLIKEYSLHMWKLAEMLEAK